MSYAIGTPRVIGKYVLPFYNYGHRMILKTEWAKENIGNGLLHVLFVIVNGESPLLKRTVDGVEQIYPLTTAEEKLAKKNELKERDSMFDRSSRFICQNLQFIWSQTSHTKSSDEILKPLFGQGFSKLTGLHKMAMAAFESQYIGFEDPDYPDKVYVDDVIFGYTNKDLCKAFEKLMKDKFQMSSMRELTFFLRLQVKQKHDRIFISQDKYVAEVLRKFVLTDRKSARTPIDTENPLLKDPDGEDVVVHTYRSMIGSLMYLTLSRPDIVFVVCACACFQVTPKASHLHAVKRIFTYLKGKPHLGLWYPKDSPFNLVAYSHSDYARASLDRKSTIGGCQFLDRRKVIVTEDTVRQALQLDDADSIDCLPNEEIFAKLQVHDDVVDAVEDKDVANEISAEPSPPSPTSTTTQITKQRVRRLEKKRKLKASGLKKLRKVGTAQRVESSADTFMDDQEDASKQGQGEIVELDANEDVTLEQCRC
nr:uncharacterized mitochondrial protein AtMg00810-like [Tanacetum cinerariifolium]